MAGAYRGRFQLGGIKIGQRKPINEQNTFVNEMIGPVIVFFILVQYFKAKHIIVTNTA